jgi:hypothetical protein
MTVGRFAFIAACLVPAGALAEPQAAALVARADASTQAYRFGGTQWGASVAETTGALAVRGFRLDGTPADGDLIYVGILNDRPALVVALFGAEGLSKILVSVPADEANAMATYHEMKRILGGEYGAPEIDVETYEYPFADGKHVGYEAAAIRVGKATIGALWKANGEALGLKITDRLIVSAHYESPAWRQESERRVRRVGP